MRSEILVDLGPASLAFAGLLTVLTSIVAGGGFASGDASVPVLLIGISLASAGALWGATRPPS